MNAVNDHLHRILESLESDEAVLPFEVLSRALANADGQPLDIAIASEVQLKEGEFGIMPSLCLYKPPNQSARILRNWHDLNHLFGTVQVDISVSNSLRFTDFAESASRNRNYISRDQFVTQAIGAGFTEYHFAKLRTTILVRGPNKLSLVTMELLARTAFSLRSHSLNLRNESLRLANDDWSQLENRLRGVSKLPHNPIAIFASFFQGKYDLIAHCFSRSSESDVWRESSQTSDELSNYPSHRKGALEALNFHATQLAFCRPLLGVHHGMNTIVAGFVPQRELSTSRPPQRFPTDAIVLISQCAFPAYIPSNLSLFIDRYFNELRPQLQTSHVVELGRRSISSAAPLDTSSDFHSQLQAYCKQCFTEVLRLSSAFSATFRLFSPSDKQLHLLVEEMRPGVEKCVPETESRAIAITNAHSMNAKVFQSVHKPLIYSADLRKDGYTVHRPEMRSEMALAVAYKLTTIGTINFESPFADGLRRDQTYLELVRDRIQSHAKLVFDTNDQYWFARRAQVDANLHELKNYIRDFPSDLRSKVLSLISQVPIAQQEPACCLGDLSDYQRQFWTREPEVLSGSQTAIAICRARQDHTPVRLKDPSIMVDGLWMKVLKLIYYNLLTNFRNYSDPERDLLEIRHNGLKSTPIQIILNTTTSISEEALGNATISPFKTHSHISGEHEHWGLMLVGSLVRHLAGFCHVSRSDSGGLHLHAVIPLFLIKVKGNESAVAKATSSTFRAY